ncbi:hypothetical protein [Piscibacillus salipiscarius]|uniref:DUF5667 domain-containing protein n=1 Tax=Piscibacillus salipiscarius TaxID=299480 RepID=A0ABW5QC31_9BACI|nr:hypothetical protein [Piscibacillus salipiscarius]
MKRRKLIHSVSAATLTASMVLAPMSISADNHESTKDSDETKVVVKEETTLEEKLFSYYGKVTDQLSLALEEEDTERVGLILDWSLQQIEEAELLYQQGLEEDANILLEEALYILENAESDEEESSEEENEETNEEEQENEDEASEDETSEEEDVVEEDDEDEEETEEEENEVVGQNVISLALAMEKVKNPNAQASLKRNIERSLDRLQAKYGEEELSALYERLNGITDEFAQEDSEETPEEGTSDEEQTEEDSSTEEPTEEPEEVEEPTEEDEVVEEEVDEVKVEEDREENYEVKSSDQKSKGKSNFGKEKAKEAKSKASEKGNKGKGKGKGKGNGKGPNN